jgi:hypothetical protein
MTDKQVHQLALESQIVACILLQVFLVEDRPIDLLSTALLYFPRLAL